ncbi:hypothetical protein [Corallincola spongiicola]|uniref:Uncharacterized protein n=1 Tax=Corallincola spongiicola TaxID=2520508 RepID=A0ABY1WM62_9GAMM|nr:hypothetical protein [Corallincola spongiicola]TAA42577.1 hypothetical protein EXY25_14895 [Corallincola spongiicola]
MHPKLKGLIKTMLLALSILSIGLVFLAWYLGFFGQSLFPTTPRAAYFTISSGENWLEIQTFNSAFASNNRQQRHLFPQFLMGYGSTAAGSLTGYFDLPEGEVLPDTIVISYRIAPLDRKVAEAFFSSGEGDSLAQWDAFISQQLNLQRAEYQSFNLSLMQYKDDLAYQASAKDGRQLLLLNIRFQADGQPLLNFSNTYQNMDPRWMH